jgi:hypothetical protein
MSTEKTWINEIEDAFKAMDELDNVVWTASVNFSAGSMIAELIPDFKTANSNGFYLHESLKQSLLNKLNSGKVFLRDSHSKSIKDILGTVRSGKETPDGKIDIEADVDEDPRIESILKNHKDKMGVSLGGHGLGYCTKCGKRVEGMRRCWDHPTASIVVKQFELTEVSLTDDPAWSTSKVKDYN